jgi:hypothetical protein
MPRVLCFFFKFLLKNRVFPDTVDEQKFQAALRIAESGHKELPLTSVIAKFLPDQFSVACQQYWGSQRKYSAWSDDEGDDIANELDGGDNDIVVPDGTGITSNIAKITFEKDEEEVPEPPSTSSPKSKPVPKGFKTLLASGNIFPTAHTLGFVEHSLRRIKRVLPPGVFVSARAKSYRPAPDTSINSINAIEHDLETILAKVTLVPWVGSGLDGFDQPETFRRPDHMSNEDELDNHDPLEDEITALLSITLKQLGVLRDAVGMGIAGTWVQIRPIGEEGADPRRLKYWYLEESVLVVPSFETR